MLTSLATYFRRMNSYGYRRLLPIPQDGQILLPRPDGTSVNLCHRPRNLADVIQIMYYPSRQQLAERNLAKPRVLSSFAHIGVR